MFELIIDAKLKRYSDRSQQEVALLKTYRFTAVVGGKYSKRGTEIIAGDRQSSKCYRWSKNVKI